MSDGSAFSNGFMNAYRAFSDAEEKRKEQQSMKAYFDMQAADAQMKVQPFDNAATAAREQSFSADATRQASQMTDAAVANNPALTQRTAQGPVTPAQQSAWQTNNQAATAQAGAREQQANQELMQMKERYGTEMFSKLGSLVEKGMDPKMAIKIADQQVLKAEQLAEKQALSSAMSVFGDKTATQEQKQQAALSIAAIKPEIGRMFQNYFAPKTPTMPSTFTPGSYVVQSDGSYKQMGTPASETISANTRFTQEQENARARMKPPTGQLTEHQKWQQSQAANQEKTQNIPGFGNITNSQILSLYSSAQPKEVQREAFNPINGNKEMMKSIDPGKPDTMALLKPFVDKIKGVAPVAPSGNGGSSIDWENPPPEVKELAIRLKAQGKTKAEIEAIFRQTGE